MKLSALSSLLLLVASLAQPPPKAPPVFGVSVEYVHIDAFVSRRGEPVTGLVASDFELRDNGVLQQIELAASDAQPLLAVLVFDVSNSLAGERLEGLKAASQALLDALRPQDQATLFTFSDQVEWLVRPTEDKAAVRGALNRLRPGGGTLVMDALYTAITLPRSTGRTLVVLFTDGVDNMSWLDGQRVRSVAERSNALVHVVSLLAPGQTAQSSPLPFGRGGQTRSADEMPTLEFEDGWALNQIAETTGGRYWEAESPERLKAAFSAIAESLGRRYVLRYVPEKVERAGWHRIELRLKGKRGDLQTRRGYWVFDR
jgi:VWFA-related protein